MSSLRKGHANLLCIVPILTDASFARLAALYTFYFELGLQVAALLVHKHNITIVYRYASRC